MADNPDPLVFERRQTSRLRGEERRKDKEDEDEDDDDDEEEEEEEEEEGRGSQRLYTRGAAAALFAFANAKERRRHGEGGGSESGSGSGGGEDEGSANVAERRQKIDALEVFEHVRDIRDPEHPYSLEQLSVVGEDKIEVDDERGRVSVSFTPTVQHCSMATLIGLSLRVKLMRVLPPRFKVDVRVSPGSHASESAVNKQLNDKERVCAALENPNLVDMVFSCIDNAGGNKTGA